MTSTIIPLARSQATDPGFLKELAHEINVRLQKADDHRLSAALKLAEAKAACKKAHIPFKAWVDKEIQFIGYSQANKLAKIGSAKNPEKALEDLREKTRRTVRVSTEKKSGLARPFSGLSLPEPPRGKDVIRNRVTNAILDLSGLPSAAAVVEYFRDTDQAILVDENLEATFRWLEEFYKLWRTNDAENDAE